MIPNIKEFVTRGHSFKKSITIYAYNLIQYVYTLHSYLAIILFSHVLLIHTGYTKKFITLSSHRFFNVCSLCVSHLL